jgi:phosphoribosylformylglycinamidine cyclo-ligase
MDTRYSKRGVSSKKEDVHNAVKHLDKGLFPNAFCKVLPDILAGDPDYCTIMHADGAGTKSALAYIYWREYSDFDVWQGIAEDAVIMNIDDLLCVGATNNMILSSTIGRNAIKIPSKVILNIIKGTDLVLEKLRSMGVDVYLSGGETADVGDLVRTVIVDASITCRMKRSEVIENHIQPGDVIVGFASYGQATYENTYNSGIGSNGLTSARHDSLHYIYASKYPETFDDVIPKSLIYTGENKLGDIEKETGIEFGKLLLSPTRTYAPIVKEILAQHRGNIHGMIHCSGGGQTKVLKFVEQVKIIKDNMLPVPPIFRIIQKNSGTEWGEMYEVFNMGHRLEVYLDAQYADDIIKIAGKFNVDAQIIGRVEPSEKKELVIRSDYGEYFY